MLEQQGHAREGAAAGLAAVLLDVRVRLQVGPQVGAVGERSAAVRAGERLLARVRPDVSLQQPGPREGLAAQLALAGERVRADVHLERAQRRVVLLAVLARKGLARGRRAVELPVLGEAAVGGVAATAAGARVPGRVLGPPPGPLGGCRRAPGLLLVRRGGRDAR